MEYVLSVLAVVVVAPCAVCLYAIMMVAAFNAQSERIAAAQRSETGK